MKKLIKKLFYYLNLFKTKNEKKNLLLAKKLKSKYYKKWLIGLGTAFIITILLSPNLQQGLKEYQLGDIATKDIKSTQDLLVEDERSTLEKRIEAEKLVFSIYDYDPTPQLEAESFIKSLIKSSEGIQEINKIRKQWEPNFHIPLSQKEWNILEKERLNPNIQETFSKIVIPILKKGIINDKNLLDAESNKGIIIRDIHTNREKKDDPPFTFLDLKEAKIKLRNEAELFTHSGKKELSPIIIKVAENFLKPNLTFNKNETENRKAKAREAIHPVYFQIKRGEIIIRKGDRVKEDHLIKINALKKSHQKNYILSMMIGIGLLSFILLVSIYQFANKNIRKFSLSVKDLIFFSSTLLGILILLKLYLLITDILGGEFISIPSSSYIYLFPFASGAMLIRIVLNSEIAIIFSILGSYFSTSLIGSQLFLFIFIFIGSIIGAHNVAQCEKRSTLLKAGLTVGVFNLIMIFGFNLLSENPFKMTLLSDLLMGFIGGPLASVITLGITSIIESLFGYTTDIKLLELANMDNPILKDLVLQAPGTYHHSIITGTLVEAAAKSVSANPLLARVSAYYHDIGKLKKPLYFIENVGGMENKHDHLSPHISSLILISHVKDGVELARENHLGDRITNIIQQHHGTSLITYFYQKAKEKENPEMSTISEKDFRYPGPKPQTKEAGIVMLADAVEAASRTLTEPTPARIKSLVQRIINNIFLDGQLEECELTLKDLHNIEESFTRILTGIFHQRIDYPILSNDEPTKKRNDEDLDSRSTKTYPFRLKQGKKGSH
jgi:putative nucleotidyltransferase with HDIG domain